MAKPADKPTALWVIRRLRQAGFRALLAGGCVRDMLLGHRPGDYDVATDATPSQVRRLFDHVLLVGAKFGVAMVLHRRRKVEVTTFRTDASYSDGRRPDAVTFSTPRHDALRRDFTINGMFYDPLAGKVLDYVGGQRDLRRRVVRTIGQPAKRFAEDYLRMLRAVRFAVRLGFRIDPPTAAAIRRHAGRITAISGERIFDELSRMLAHPAAGEALEKLDELKLAAAILPELFASKDLWPAAVRRVARVAKCKDPALALGALLCELPAGEIRRITRRWGASNDLREGLCFLAGHLEEWGRAEEMPLCDLKRRMAHPQFANLRVLWRIQEKRRTGRTVHSRRIAQRIGRIDPAQVTPRPLVTGADLMKMGLREGPRLGKILRALYDAQLNEEVPTRADALRCARETIDAMR